MTLKIFFVAFVLLISSITIRANESSLEIASELNEYYGDITNIVAAGKDFMNWNSNESILGPLSTDDLKNFLMNNEQGTSLTGPSLAILGAPILDMWIDGDNYTTVDVEYKSTPNLGFESLTGPFLLNGSNSTFNATHSYEEKKTRVYWPTQLHKEHCVEKTPYQDTCYFNDGTPYSCTKWDVNEYDRVYEKAVRLSKYDGSNWIKLYDNSSANLSDTRDNGGTVSIFANRVITDDVADIFGYKYKLEVKKREQCSTKWKSNYGVKYEMNVDADLDGLYDNIPGLYYNKVRAAMLFGFFENN